MRIPISILFIISFLIIPVAHAEVDSIPLTFVSENSNGTLFNLGELKNYEVEGIHALNIMGEDNEIDSLVVGEKGLKEQISKIDDNLANYTLLSQVHDENGKIPVIIKLKPKKSESRLFGIIPLPKKQESKEKMFQNAKAELAAKLETESEDLKIIESVAAEVSLEKLDEIEALDVVEKIYLDEKVEVLLQNSVPLIGADNIWKLRDSNGRNITGKNISIAIIDTGVDYTHPDLGGCLGSSCKVAGGYDFVNNDNNPMDDHGHGTHVAATAAGNGTLKGVAPDAKIYAYKVLSSGGWGYWSWVISGIERATDPNNDGNFSDHVNIISMSLGGSGDEDDLVSQASDKAVDRGVVVVVAAGNSGTGENAIGSPGSSRKSITVAASDKNDAMASFSSRGPTPKGNVKPDLTAPGVSICAAQWDSWLDSRHCYDDKHISISGTSMATPHVSGAAALLLQANSSFKPEMIKSALMITSNNVSSSVWAQGSGRINLTRALSTPILTYPQSISFGQMSSSNRTAKLTIQNLNNANLTFNVSAGFVYDDLGNSYNISYLVDSGGNNISSVTVLASQNATINLTVNLGSVEGKLFGYINLTRGEQTFRVPYGLVRLGGLTVNVVDSTGKALQPFFFIAHDKNYTNVKVAYYTTTARFNVPGGDYIVNAIGDSSNYSLYYILTGNITVPAGGEATLNISTNNTKPVNVTAYNLQNKSIDLYKWDFGFRKTEGFKRISSSVAFIGFGFPGDRLVHLSKTENDTSDTVNFSFSYIGYPPRKNTFNISSYTWNSETYNTAEELYFAGWTLNNTTDTNTQILNYTLGELGMLNYTYNWPGSDPSIGAAQPGYGFIAINFWISPISSFDFAIWEQIAVPLKRTAYVKGPDWGFWHYMQPNYLHFSDWLTEFNAAARQYEYDKEYEIRWPIGTKVAGGTNRNLQHGTTPYLPAYFRNTNTTINITDYFLSSPDNQTHIFKYESSSLNINLPRVLIYKDGSLVLNKTERWDNCAKSKSGCSFVFPYTASAGSYLVNISLKTSYPIQNETIVTGNFSLPSVDVTPPALTFLNVSPRFEVNKNLSIEFNITDDRLANAAAYISYDRAAWSSILLTNASNRYTGNLNATNSEATEISLKIIATDATNNQMNYTFLPISMLARNITFPFSPSKTTANRGDIITFTGRINDSPNNKGLSPAKLYYSQNNVAYDVGRSSYFGTVGSFTAKWIVPSDFSSTSANFSVTYNGTGVYLPLTNVSQLTINIPQAGPSYSSLSISPPSPDANDNATISVIWSNANTVIFESNFTNTLQNYTPAQSGSNYSFAIYSGNFTSGKIITYRYYANDSTNAWNSIPARSFAIQEIPTNITAGQSNLEVDVNRNNTLRCGYMEIGAGDILAATVQAEISGANNTMTYNSTTARYEYNYNTTNQSTGTKTWKCYASKSNYQTKSISSSFSIRAETDIPTFSNTTQSPAIVFNSDNVVLNSTWQDNGGLSTVTFTSNFSGSWRNYTVAVNPSNTYNANFTILSGNLSSKQIVGWKFLANDTSGNLNALMPIQAFSVENRIPLITITENQTSGGWGEPWTFKANVSDPDGDAFNVTIWSNPPSGNYSMNETQSGQTNVSTQFTFSSRYLTSAFIGNSLVKFNVTDFKGGTNETMALNITVEKDDLNATVAAGNNRTIERFGKDNITLSVAFFDTDRNEAINANGKIYVTRSGSLPYDVIEDCTVTNSNCSVVIDPDVSYEAGLHFFTGGIPDIDQIYKPINSSQANFTVLGQLFVFVDSPFGAFNVLDEVFFNATVYDDKSAGSGDPNPKPLKADKVTLEYRKSDSTAEWKSCPNVNETSGERSVYYTCSINITNAEVIPGFYGVRYTAEKANHTTNNITNTHQFIAVRIIRFSTLANLTAVREHKINVSNINASIEIRPMSNLTNVRINMTMNTSNPVAKNLSSVELGKYLMIEVDDALNNNLSYAVIKVNYTDEEIAGYNISESSLRLYRFNGTEWVPYDNQSSNFTGGVNTVENYVWGNVTQFSNFTIGGKKSNGQACNSNDQCVSGSCVADYDAEGNWCAPAGYCGHDYDVSTYTNGYNLCSDSSTRQTCNSGVWTSQTCSSGCSSGACTAASVSGSSVSSGPVSSAIIPSSKEHKISQSIEASKEIIKQRILEENFKQAFEPLSGKLTDKRAEELVEVSKALSEKVSQPTRSLFTGSGVSSLLLTVKNIGNESYENFVIYDMVPKTFAKSSDEIILDAPEALISTINRDPEYMFVYPSFRAGQEIKINYTINRNINQSVINDTISPIILLANPPSNESEKVVCALITTSAVNQLTGECTEFPTPCDVPEGWKIVGQCPLELEEEEKDRTSLFVIVAVMIIAGLYYAKTKYKIISKIVKFTGK